MRRILVVLMLLAGVALPSILVTATGSSTLFNDTGSEVYGLRVVFDQPVIITRMGEAFASWVAEQDGAALLFGNGSVGVWEDFYFFWEPKEATLLSYDWLSQAPALEDAPAVEPVVAAVQEVSGTLHRDKTWSGTIRVTGDVYVPPGRTLTILPGTVIRFAVRSDSVNHPSGFNNCPAPKAELIVEGTLNAHGTKNNPILFTSDGVLRKPGDWGGIILHGAARPVTLSYLIIEYADINLTAFSSGIVVENCIIRNAYGGLDDCPTANHWEVRTGLFLTGERSIVRNCEVANCTWGFHIGQEDPTKTAIRIENCHIHDNDVTSPGFDVPNGIHIFNSNVHIEGNTIENNDWGIEVGVRSKVVILANTLAGNSVGVVQYYEDVRELSQGYLCDNQTEGNGMDYAKMTPWGPGPMPEDWFRCP